MIRPSKWTNSMRDVRLDDVAMMLARRGLSYDDIRRVMARWSEEAAERAVEWAMKEDRLIDERAEAGE